MKEDQILALRPSELIELALSDLEACEANPIYTICMGVWHSRSMDDRCQVCLAGSVMAQNFDLDPMVTVVPDDVMGAELASRMDALDNFRCGLVKWGLNDMGINYRQGDVRDICVRHYDEDPARFKDDMRDIMRMLQKVDL